MACDALLGRDSAISIAGFSGSGYIRDYHVSISVEQLDATGMGGNSGGSGGLPVRQLVAAWSSGSFSANALVGSSASHPDPGSTISVSGDVISGNYLVTDVTNSGTYDQFVMISVAGSKTAC